MRIGNLLEASLGWSAVFHHHRHDHRHPPSPHPHDYRHHQSPTFGFGDPQFLMPGAAYKLHDFGFRGVSSVESAAMGGLGHGAQSPWLLTHLEPC